MATSPRGVRVFTYWRVTARTLNDDELGCPLRQVREKEGTEKPQLLLSL